MGKFRILAAALVAAVALSACSDEPTSPAAPAPEAPSSAQLDVIFAEAGSEFGVPIALLKSIGYVETRWEMVRGGSEFPGQQPAFGIMALRGERLEQAESAAVATRAAARMRNLPIASSCGWRVWRSRYEGAHARAGCVRLSVALAAAKAQEGR